MSTTTFGLDRARPVGDVQSRVAASLKALAARFSENQKARADRVVRPYLARMPDADLDALGFSPAEIAAIRRDCHAPVVGWV